MRFTSQHFVTVSWYATRRNNHISTILNAARCLQYICRTGSLEITSFPIFQWCHYIDMFVIFYYIFMMWCLIKQRDNWESSGNCRKRIGQSGFCSCTTLTNGATERPKRDMQSPKTWRKENILHMNNTQDRCNESDNQCHVPFLSGSITTVTQLV